MWGVKDSWLDAEVYSNQASSLWNEQNWRLDEWLANLMLLCHRPHPTASRRAQPSRAYSLGNKAARWLSNISTHLDLVPIFWRGIKWRYLEKIMMVRWCLLMLILLCACVFLCASSCCCCVVVVFLLCVVVSQLPEEKKYAKSRRLSREWSAAANQRTPNFHFYCSMKRQNQIAQHKSMLIFYSQSLASGRSSRCILVCRIHILSTKTTNNWPRGSIFFHYSLCSTQYGHHHLRDCWLVFEEFIAKEWSSSLVDLTSCFAKSNSSRIGIFPSGSMYPPGALPMTIGPRTIARLLFVLVYSSSASNRLSKSISFAYKQDFSFAFFCNCCSSFIRSFSAFLRYSQTITPPETANMNVPLSKSEPLTSAASSSMRQIDRTLYPKDQMVNRVDIAWEVCPTDMSACLVMGYLTHWFFNDLAIGLARVLMKRPSNLESNLSHYSVSELAVSGCVVWARHRFRHSTATAGELTE